MLYSELVHVPPILDFEASSLSDTSYPISAGLIVEGKVYYWIIKPGPDWIDWSLQSQAIHGLKRSYIEDHGSPADQVFSEMSELLTSHSIIYSDAPEWESMWLSRLGKLNIKIESIYNLININKETFSSELLSNFKSHHLIPHRADHDAIAIALTIKNMWGNEAKFSSYRSEAYKMILTLFDLWELTEKQRLDLLGISEKNKNIFNDYQLGLPVLNTLGISEREGHILAIHQHLSLLFPEHQNLSYQWISQQNKKFKETPVDFVAMRGLGGLAEIRNYLANICQS